MKKEQKGKNLFTNILLGTSLIASIGYFVSVLLFKTDNTNILFYLISALILLIFNVLFIVRSVKNKQEKKKITSFATLAFILFIAFQLTSVFNINLLPQREYIKDLTGMNLADALSWASNNDVELTLDYEFSDMVPDYYIISQDRRNVLIGEDRVLNVAVSEGPNPDKEIILPNMVTWNDEDVLSFIEDNYLSNVDFEFVLSDFPVDTLSDQSRSGSMRRSDELLLTFSLGESFDESEVMMIDLTNKTRIQSLFWLRRHHVAHEWEEDFSNDINQGNVMDQSIPSGDFFDRDDTTLSVTLSKGREVVVPNLEDMTLEELTRWVIDNRLRLSISDEYHESIQRGLVIRSSKAEGDTIAQRSTIEIVISRGPLVMINTRSISEFKRWAERHGITYEEELIWSEEVAAGELISFSHRAGQTIASGESIIIRISQGTQITVPNLVGMSRTDIIRTLDNLNLRHTFVYQEHASIRRDVALRQSIDADSEVAANTVITITLSNGPTPVNNQNRPNQGNNATRPPANNNTGNNNNSTPGNNNNNNQNTPPVCDRNITTQIWLTAGSTGVQTRQMILSSWGMINWTFSFVDSCPNGSVASGAICNAGSIDGQRLNHCDTFNVIIVN